MKNKNCSIKFLFFVILHDTHYAASLKTKELEDLLSTDILLI